jgi:hypothetical protein
MIENAASQIDYQSVESDVAPPPAIISVAGPSRLPLIMMTLLAVLGFSAAGFFGYQYFTIKQATISVSAPVKNNLSEKTSKQTEEWHAYNSPDGIFLISYPTSAKLDANKETEGDYITIKDHMPPEEDCTTAGCNLGILHYQIEFRRIPFAGALDSFVNKMRNDTSMIADDISPVESTTVNGYDSLSYSGYAMGYFINHYIQVSQTELLRISLAYASQEGYEEHKEVTDRILSTLVININ